MVTVVTCKEGYFLDSTTLSCKGCENTNTVTCTSAILAQKCKEGYFLKDNKTCTGCKDPAKAKECSSATMDTICKDGHFLDTTSATSHTCTACTTGATKTIKCKATDDDTEC